MHCTSDRSIRNFKGVIEADETFVGGLAKNMHKKMRGQDQGNGRIEQSRCHGIA